MQISTVVPWDVVQCQHIQNRISQVHGQQSIDRYERNHTGMHFLASLMCWFGGLGIFEVHVLQKVAMIMGCHVHLLLPLLRATELSSGKTSSLLQDCQKNTQIEQSSAVSINPGEDCELILHLEITVDYKAAHLNVKEYINKFGTKYLKVEKPLKKP